MAPAVGNANESAAREQAGSLDISWGTRLGTRGGRQACADAHACAPRGVGGGGAPATLELAAGEASGDRTRRRTRTHAPAASALPRPCDRGRAKCSGPWLAGEHGARVVVPGGVCLATGATRVYGSAGEPRGSTIYRGNGGHALEPWLASMRTRCPPQPPAGGV